MTKSTRKSIAGLPRALRDLTGQSPTYARVVGDSRDARIPTSYIDGGWWYYDADLPAIAEHYGLKWPISTPDDTPATSTALRAPVAA